MATNSCQVTVTINPSLTAQSLSAMIFATATATAKARAISYRLDKFPAWGINKSHYLATLQDQTGWDFTPSTELPLNERRQFLSDRLSNNLEVFVNLMATLSSVGANLTVLSEAPLADVFFDVLGKADISVVWASEIDKVISQNALKTLQQPTPPLLPQQPETPPAPPTPPPQPQPQPTGRHHAFPLPKEWEGKPLAELCQLLAGPDGMYGAVFVNGNASHGNGNRIVVSGTDEQMGCSFDDAVWYEIAAQFVNGSNETIKEVYAYIAAADSAHAMGILETWIRERVPEVVYTVKIDSQNHLYLDDYRTTCQPVKMSNPVSVNNLTQSQANSMQSPFYWTNAYRLEKGETAYDITGFEQRFAALEQQNVDITVLVQRVTALETANATLQQQLAQQSAVIEALLQRVAALEQKAEQSGDIVTATERFEELTRQVKPSDEATATRHQEVAQDMSVKTLEIVGSIDDFKSFDKAMSDEDSTFVLETGKFVKPVETTTQQPETPADPAAEYAAAVASGGRVQCNPADEGKQSQQPVSKPEPAPVNVNELVRGSLTIFGDNVTSLKWLLTDLNQGKGLATDLQDAENGNAVRVYTVLTVEQAEAAKNVIAATCNVDMLVDNAVNAFGLDLLEDVMTVLDSRKEIATELTVDEASGDLGIGGFVPLSDAQAEVAKAAIADVIVRQRKAELTTATTAAPTTSAPVEPTNNSNKLETGGKWATVIAKYCAGMSKPSAPTVLSADQYAIELAKATADYNRKIKLAERRFDELFGDDVDRGEKLLAELLQQFNPHQFQNIDSDEPVTSIGFYGNLRGVRGYYEINVDGDKLVTRFLCP